MTLYERLEQKLDEHKGTDGAVVRVRSRLPFDSVCSRPVAGQLLRSCVELAKAWRTDKYLRQLNAVLLVVDKHTTLELTGHGDVLESQDGVMAVGSGGPLGSSCALRVVRVRSAV